MATLVDHDLLAMRLEQAAQRIAYIHLAPDLVVRAVTANLEQLLGIKPVWVIGRPLTETLYQFVGAEAYILDVLRGVLPVYRVERINLILPDQSAHYFDFEVNRFTPTQPEDGLLISLEDTTHLGQLEQALVQERNELRLVQLELARTHEALKRTHELKSIFLSLAAHDLRSPLVTIRGYAELLATHLDSLTDLDQDEIIPRCLNTIRVQSDWLDHIINNVIELDQIEQQQLNLHFALCHLNQIVEETVAVMEPMSLLYEQTMTVELPPENIFIHGAHARLRQMLQNLIGNAIKYTPPGGRVRVRLTGDHDTATLEVSDTGCGIAPEALPNIYQLYYRSADAQKSRVRGAGLGLYIVKNLVEAHRGRIEVASVLNQGATFTVHLPRSRPPVFDA